MVIQQLTSCGRGAQEPAPSSPPPPSPPPPSSPCQPSSSLSDSPFPSSREFNISMHLSVLKAFYHTSFTVERARPHGSSRRITRCQARQPQEARWLLELNMAKSHLWPQVRRAPQAAVLQRRLHAVGLGIFTGRHRLYLAVFLLLRRSKSQQADGFHSFKRGVRCRTPSRLSSHHHNHPHHASVAGENVTISSDIRTRRPGKAALN